MFFFFNDTATTEIYTLSLHDALPIWAHAAAGTEVSPPGAEPLGRREHGLGRRRRSDPLPGHRETLTPAGGRVPIRPLSRARERGTGGAGIPSRRPRQPRQPHP